MPFSRLFALFLLAAGLNGCSTMVVSHDYDPDADFARLKSYGWIPEPRKPSGDPRIDHNTLLEERIEKAVETQLNAKGYVKKASGTPDFWLAFYVTLDRKTSVTMLNSYYGYGPGWGWGLRYGGYGAYGLPSAYAYEYDEGTLILDVVEPATRRLLWRGYATDEVNLSQGPKADEKQINEAVRRLLERFPPEKRAPPQP
jgi:hypothetical protein